MNKLINLLASVDGFYLWPILISILTAFTISGSYLAVKSYLPPKLPLFYSLPWGEKQLTSSDQFIFLAAIILITTALNTLITYQIHPSQVILRRFLMLGVVGVDLVILTTAVQILFIFI